MFHRRQRIAWLVSLIAHASVIALVYLAIRAVGGSAAHHELVDTRLSGIDDDCTALTISDASHDSEPTPKPLPQEIIHPHPKADSFPTKVGGPEPLQPVAGVQDPPSAPKGRVAIPALHGALPPDGYTVVYVLDASGSMGNGKKWSHARAMLSATLRKLTPKVRFQVVVYDSIARGLWESPIEATSANLQEAERQLDHVVPEGSSRHVEGMRVGLRTRPNLVILLTDADDLSAADARTIRGWNADNLTQIHAILVGTPRTTADSALREICRGGRVIRVPIPEKE